MATNINVFVSYSHADASLVAPIVRLLRSNKSLVFQDVDNIRPGKKWREEIAAALIAADQVYVFWCDHSLASVEVKNEWEIAISQKKDVIPVLLDATPLPMPLAEFQWIDFRDMVAERHGVAGPSLIELTTARDQEMFQQSSPKASIPLLPILLVLGGLVALLAGRVMLSPATLPKYVDALFSFGLTLILGGGGAALSFYILRQVWRSISERRQDAYIKQSHSHEASVSMRIDPVDYSMRLGLAGDSAMAATLEAEILRRFEKSNTSRNAN